LLTFHHSLYTAPLFGAVAQLRTGGFLTVRRPRLVDHALCSADEFATVVHALPVAADSMCVHLCSIIALFVVRRGLAMVESARILCDCVDVCILLLTSSSNPHPTLALAWVVF
jgi:hypothetical protein